MDSNIAWFCKYYKFIKQNYHRFQLKLIAKNLTFRSKYLHRHVDVLTFSYYLSWPNALDSSVELMLQALKLLYAQGIKIFPHKIPAHFSFLISNYWCNQCTCNYVTSLPIWYYAKFYHQFSIQKMNIVRIQDTNSKSSLTYV